MPSKCRTALIAEMGLSHAVICYGPCRRFVSRSLNFRLVIVSLLSLFWKNKSRHMRSPCCLCVYLLPCGLVNIVERTHDWIHTYTVSESYRQMTLLVVVQIWQVNHYDGETVDIIFGGSCCSNMVLACWKWRSENRPESVTLYRGYVISEKQICCWCNELVTQGVMLLHEQPPEWLQCSRSVRLEFTLQLRHENLCPPFLWDFKLAVFWKAIRSRFE
jgi:hypothetical protein